MGYQKLSYSDYYPFGMQMPSRTYTPSDSYKYGFNGMEKDGELSGEGNSYTTQFRQYDPRLGRWKSVDPLAHKRVSWTPYNFCRNNPTNNTDPTGALDSPIYGTDGNFLGTDDEGLQGKAIIMDKGNFIQGMSHEEAENHNLGYSALKGEAFNTFWNTHISLSRRPDWDGILTSEEGVNWAKSHPGALENPTPENMIYINTAKLNFGNLSANDFKSVNSIEPKNLLNAHNMLTSLDNPTVSATVYALGRVNMILTNRQKGSVQIVNDYNLPSGRATDYDWNTGDGVLRNLLILRERFKQGLNDSHGFRVYYYGTGTLNTKLVDWTLTPSQYK